MLDNTLQSFVVLFNSSLTCIVRNPRPFPFDKSLMPQHQIPRLSGASSNVHLTDFQRNASQGFVQASQLHSLSSFGSSSSREG